MFLKKIIDGNEEEYFLLLLGSQRILEVEELIKTEKSCIKLIRQNKIKQYFFKGAFWEFYSTIIIKLKKTDRDDYISVFRSSSH